MNNEEIAEKVIDYLVKFNQLKNPDLKEALTKQIVDMLDFEERKILEKLTACTVCGKPRSECR
jgi:hypothetical protein